MQKCVFVSGKLHKAPEHHSEFSMLCMVDMLSSNVVGPLA